MADKIVVDPITGKKTVVDDSVTGLTEDTISEKTISGSNVPGLQFGDNIATSSSALVQKNPYTEYMGTKGLFGLENGTWNNMGQAAGLAGSAYNLYDQTLGNSADLFKEKIGMLKEQRAANQEALANHRAFNSVWNNAGNGLAAKSYVAPADNGIKSVVKL